MAVREARIQRRMALPAQLVQVVVRPISPSRLVLALIVAAFVLAMVWVQQTQAIVRVGGEVQSLERRLEVLLQTQQDLRAQLATENGPPNRPAGGLHGPGHARADQSAVCEQSGPATRRVAGPAGLGGAGPAAV